jgi:hypothetical protein
VDNVWNLLPGLQNRAQILSAGRPGGADRAERADEAARVAWKADGRAQIHESLVIISSPPGRQVLMGQIPEGFLTHGGICRLGHIEQPGIEAPNITVQRGLIQAKGHGRNRPGGVATDPGELAKVIQVNREPTIKVPANEHGSLVEITRPTIVAQPFPEIQDILF